MKNTVQKLALFGGGLFTALLASTCCVGPLLSVAALLGLSAAHVTVLATAKPFLMGLSLSLTGIGLILSYRKRPSGCCPTQTTGSLRIFSTSRALLWISVLITALVLLWPYAVEASQPTQKAPSIPDVQLEKTAIYVVEGMRQTCCTRIVEYALKEVKGYLRMQADVKTQKLSVWYDPSKTNAAQIQAALDKSPYKAKLPQ